MGGLTSFGIGLTKLRAIAKQVGRDHDLALRLWNERNHDAKIIGLLIDDPKELTRDQVEKQVIGTAEASLHHHPEVWRDWGSREDVLQHLKQLWHVLVHYGVPAHRTTDDFLGD